jgi:hypothetical protein
LGSTIFQLYRGGQFYWWMTPEYPEKATDLPQSIMMYREQHLLCMSQVRTWISKATCHGLFCVQWWVVVVSFCYHGEIVDQHCLNFLFTTMWNTFWKNTIISPIVIPILSSLWELLSNVKLSKCITLGHYFADH